MDQNSIDRLFREQAERYTLEPTASAWDQIEGGLQEKRSKKLWYAIAASLAFIVASVFTINAVLKSDQVETVSLAEISVDTPEPIIAHSLVLPDKPPVTAAKVQQKMITQDIKPTLETIIELPQQEVIKLADVQRKGLEKIHFNLEIPARPEKISEENNGIQIKYYADATQSQKSSSKRKIGDLIDFAQNNSPAEVLANLREVKDNFISSKFSLD